MDARQGQDGRFDASRWTGAQKDAVADAFERARSDLRAKIEQKADPDLAHQVMGLIDAYFKERIETLRSVTAGSG